MLGNYSFGEGSVRCVILTSEIGMVSALAQGARKTRSKLKGSLQPLSFGLYSFVKGKNGWRITYAEEKERFSNVFRQKKRIFFLWHRLFGLLRKLVAGEDQNEKLFALVESAFSFSKETDFSLEEERLFESIVVLRMLHILGHLPSHPSLDLFSMLKEWNTGTLHSFKESEKEAIAYINESITQSGL
ncbi:MAG: recombination protein O N-terminal domain-containing protein [Candidatus Pacebacteria bacterium]|nr:recombination protein O N-terminal domain-containing protein [Candidatus Paceibacterota bacterium]